MISKVFFIFCLVIAAQFSQGGEPPQKPLKVDVLWVIDNSGSMRTSQDHLARHFRKFIEQFSDRNVDFKIGVTTTDAYLANQKFRSFYEYNGAYGNYAQKYFEDMPQHYKSRLRDGASGYNSGVFVITPGTRDIVKVFRTNVTQGTNGWGYERPFDSIKEFFDSSFNRSFFRDNSLWSLIVVTDEDDFSTGTSDWAGSTDDDRLISPESVTSFLDEQSESGFPVRRHMVSSISIGDRQCLDSLNDKFTERLIAHRVQTLVNMTGGYNLSLCDPMDKNLSALAIHILDRATGLK